MTRSVHIPARFVIGFPLPAHQSQGVVPGYHCWAEFYLAAKGWVPVDIAEASLHQAKYNFFFGSVGDNRVRFSAGRDITLAPKQAGPPVNYFVYPYVELNGKPYKGVEDHFSFRNTSSCSKPGVAQPPAFWVCDFPKALGRAAGGASIAIFAMCAASH